MSEGGIPRRYRYGAYRKMDRTESEGVELRSGRLNVVNQGKLELCLFSTNIHYSVEFFQAFLTLTCLLRLLYR